MVLLHSRSGLGNPSGIIASMDRLFIERERKAVRQQVKPMVEMLAPPWAIALVLAVAVVAAYFAGVPGTEYALNFILDVAGPLLFYQSALLLAAGIIAAWHYVTERHRVNALICHVAGRFSERALRLARRWYLTLWGAWFPVRLPTSHNIRLVWRERVAIIGSGFVPGESPQLE